MVGGLFHRSPTDLKTPLFWGCHAKKKRIKLIKVSRGKKLIRQKKILYRCEARPLKFGAGAPSQLLWLGSVPDSVPATPWLLGTQLLLRRVPKWLPRSRPSTADTHLKGKKQPNTKKNRNKCYHPHIIIPEIYFQRGKRIYFTCLPLLGVTKRTQPQTQTTKHSQKRLGTAEEGNWKNQDSQQSGTAEEEQKPGPPETGLEIQPKHPNAT